jgi:hypothetical protein
VAKRRKLNSGGGLVSLRGKASPSGGLLHGTLGFEVTSSPQEVRLDGKCQQPQVFSSFSRQRTWVLLGVQEK